MHRARDVDPEPRARRDIDCRMRTFHLRQSPDETELIAGRRRPLEWRRIDAVMNHLASRQADLATALIRGDRNELDLGEVAIECGQRLVAFVMDRVDERHVANEARSAQRDGRGRVYDIEVDGA